MTNTDLQIACAERTGNFTPANIAAWQRIEAIRHEYKSLQRRDSFSGLAVMDRLETAEADPDYIGDIPQYATCANAALALVEEMRKRGFVVSLKHYERQRTKCPCSINKVWSCEFRDIKDSTVLREADTLPRAICLAFLAATEP